MRVLIVEDELVIRTGMLRHIPWAELGVAEVKPAANAEEALAVSRESAPDVIISDISLPGMDGITLCRTLRESFPELEIIFVTGYADKEYLKAAIELHAVRYVEKPVNRQVIQEAVEEAVKRIRVKRQQKAAYLHAFLLDPESAPPFYGEEDVLSCVGILRGKERGACKDQRAPVRTVFPGDRTAGAGFPDGISGRGLPGPVPGAEEAHPGPGGFRAESKRNAGGDP